MLVEKLLLQAITCTIILTIELFLHSLGLSERSTWMWADKVLHC